MKNVLKKIGESLGKVVTLITGAVNRIADGVPNLVGDFVADLQAKPLSTILKAYVVIVILDIVFLGSFGVTNYTIDIIFDLMYKLKGFVHSFFK